MSASLAVSALPSPQRSECALASSGVATARPSWRAQICDVCHEFRVGRGQLPLAQIDVVLESHPYSRRAHQHRHGQHPALVTADRRHRPAHVIGQRAADSAGIASGSGVDSARGHPTQG